MGGMLLPLLGTEGDEGGRLEQQLVHFKQFASQPVEVAVQVHFPFLGCARFPQLALLAGVDAEAAVESHFERTEEVAELFLRTGDAQCQVGALGKYETDDYKDISPFAIATLADFYGVSTDYLMGLTENKNHPNTELQSLHLSDDMVELLSSGKII